MSIPITHRPTRHEVRRKLLDAATQAFRKYGYIRTSLTQIADSAGFTKGAIYSNFESKPELFSAVCVENISRLSAPVLAQLDVIFADGPHEPEALDEIVDSFTRIVTDFAPWQIALSEFRQLAIHDPVISGSYGMLLNDRIDQAMRLLEGHQVINRLGEQRTRDAVLTIFELISLLTMERAAAPCVLTDERTRAILRSVLKGISA